MTGKKRFKTGWVILLKEKNVFTLHVSSVSPTQDNV